MLKVLNPVFIQPCVDARTLLAETQEEATADSGYKWKEVKTLVLKRNFWNVHDVDDAEAETSAVRIRSLIDRIVSISLTARDNTCRCCF